MSAYAALRADVIGSKESPIMPSDADDNELQYVKDSDDECSDDEADGISTLDVKLESRVIERDSFTPVLSKLRIFQSDFLPSEKNLQFEEESVSIRLESGEFIMIRGMFKLQILDGSVRINNCYELNAENSHIHSFFTVDSNALPIISNASDENNTFAEIKLINYYTGFEKASNKLLSTAESITNKEKSFDRFTFDIVIQSGVNHGLFVDDLWVKYFSTTATISPNNLIVIGNKNAGKSTFCKSVLDFLRFQKLQNVAIMDLDPGQSDNSSPYCMSLSIQTPKSICTNAGFVHDKYEEYYGFSSPIDAPTRYLEITRNLYNVYTQKYKQKGLRLIVNTPGWIKGYGKTLLLQVTSIVAPSDLILLTSNMSIEAEENQNILQDLHYKTVTLLPGVFQLPSSSPSQFRIDNKLVYFHRKGTERFDFSYHLLMQPPERISYLSGTSGQGVYGLSILNFKMDDNFDFSNTSLLLSSLIWGVYSTESSCDEVLIQDRKHNLYPNMVQSKDLQTTLGAASRFLGLLIVHSINTSDHYLNIYTPPDVLSKIKGALQSRSKIILVRGEGTIPPSELLYPKHFYMGAWSQSQLPAAISSKVHVPFVNVKGKSKIGGIWKVRRNILRRSHRR